MSSDRPCALSRAGLSICAKSISCVENDPEGDVPTVFITRPESATTFLTTHPRIEDFFTSGSAVVVHEN